MAANLGIVARRPSTCRRGFATVVVAAAAVLLLAPVAHADPGLSWTQPQQAGLPADVAISCPTTDECVAVDAAGMASYSSSASTGISGSFSTQKIDTAELLAISCPTAAFCVAGDVDGYVISGNPQTDTWNAPVDIDGTEPINGISCVSASLCIAVDGDGNLLSSTNADTTASWTTTSVDGTNPLYAVSCEPTGTLCVAVDADGNAVAGDPTTASWGAPQDIDGTNELEGVNCPTTTFCLAVDDDGNALSSSDAGNASPTWTAGAIIDAGSGLLGVSCSPDEDLCVATDASGNVVATSDPTNASPSWTSLNLDAYDQPIYAVSCNSATHCAASGADGISIYPENTQSSVWGQLFAESDYVGVLTGIACADTTTCWATDSQGYLALVSGDSGAADPYVHVEPDDGDLDVLACPTEDMCLSADNEGYLEITSGLDGTPSTTIARVNGNNAITSISCPQADLCVAVGYGNAMIGDPLIDSWSTYSGVAPGSGVSCLSDTLCLNSGAATTVAIDPETSTFSSPAPAPSGLDGVACSGASTCTGWVAGGVYVTTHAAASTPTWTFDALGMEDYWGGQFSCPTPAFCGAADEAFDEDPWVITGNPVANLFTLPLSVPLAGAPQVDALSCPSDTECVIGTVNGEAAVGLGATIGVTVDGSDGAGGTVTDSDGQLDCPGTCNATYAADTTEQLTAIPNHDDMLTGWSGACSGTSTTCTVDLSSNEAVTANFAPSPVVTLGVTVEDSGGAGGNVTDADGELNCSTVCNADYLSGTSERLTATPDAGDTFTGWGGACSGTSTTCTVALSADESVTASFAPKATTASLPGELDVVVNATQPTFGWSMTVSPAPSQCTGLGCHPSDGATCANNPCLLVLSPPSAVGLQINDVPRFPGAGYTDNGYYLLGGVCPAATSCTLGSAPAGGGPLTVDIDAGTGAPSVADMSIEHATVRGHRAKVTFKYLGTLIGSAGLTEPRFQCAIVSDGRKHQRLSYRVCSSPLTYRDLANGPYTFYVRANEPGAALGTAATTRLTIGGGKAASHHPRTTADCRQRCARRLSQELP
jgi:uncharacterized repeat protein (TIGR02543 family)